MIICITIVYKRQQRVDYLHQHVLMLWVFTVIMFPAKLLHLRHQAPVAHDLQQAGLQGDAQPRDTQEEEWMFGQRNSDLLMQLVALYEHNHLLLSSLA